MPWFGEGLYFATTAAQHANHVGVGHRKVYNYRLNNSGSGLTTYKVQKGINALKNIYTLKEEQYIKEDILSNAIDWHIWKNYTFLLLQILGTGEIEKYRKFYKDSIVYIRKIALRCYIGVRLVQKKIEGTIMWVNANSLYKNCYKKEI